jgi:hypothetical protein
MTFKQVLKGCCLAVLVLLVFVGLGPARWQPRSGLGWEIDHFVGYFVITLMCCLAWPRPLVVGGALTIFAVVLEGLQALMPDRSSYGWRPSTAQPGCCRRLYLLRFSSEHGNGSYQSGRILGFDRCPWRFENYHESAVLSAHCCFWVTAFALKSAHDKDLSVRTSTTEHAD